jgi:hypothetical protein
MNFLSTGASNLNFALLQREKERGKEGEFSPKGIFDSFLCKSHYLDILCLNRKSSTPPPPRRNFFQYFIQHCFICRLSDSAVSEDAGIELQDSCDFGIGSQTL